VIFILVNRFRSEPIPGQEIYLLIYNPLGRAFFKHHFDDLKKELLQEDLEAAKFRDSI